MRLSYSKLSTFKSCPFLFKRKYIENQGRVPEGTSIAQLKGVLIHKDLEEYVKNGKKTPAAIKARVHIDPIIEGGGAKSEYDITVEYKGSEYRAIFDLYKDTGDRVLVADYKTGSVQNYDIQAQVYAGVAMIHSGRKEAEVRFIYTARNQVFTHRFDQHVLDILLRHHNDVHRAIESDDFPKVPCYKCRYCGECEWGELNVAAV